MIKKKYTYALHIFPKALQMFLNIMLVILSIILSVVLILSLIHI